MLFGRGSAARTGASAAWSRQSVNRSQFVLGFIGHHVGRPERCPSQVHIHCLVHGSSGSQTGTPLAVQMPLPAGRSGPGTTPDRNVDGSVVVGVRRMATSRTLEHCLILQLYLLELEVLATGVAALRQPLVAAPPIRPGQERPGRGRHPQPQAPQQTPDLRQAQPPAKSRARLKAARLFVSGRFFWGSGAPGRQPVLRPAGPGSRAGTSHARCVPRSRPAPSPAWRPRRRARRRVDGPAATPKPLPYCPD